MRMEAVAVIADNPGGFLAPMLQRMQPEGGDSSGVGHVPDPEHPAFVVELVVR